MLRKFAHFALMTRVRVFCKPKNQGPKQQIQIVQQTKITDNNDNKQPTNQPLQLVKVLAMGSCERAAST